MRIEESTDIILQNDENIELPASKWAPRRGDVLDEKVKEFEAKIDVKDADQVDTSVRSFNTTYGSASHDRPQERRSGRSTPSMPSSHTPLRSRGSWKKSGRQLENCTAFVATGTQLASITARGTKFESRIRPRERFQTAHVIARWAHFTPQLSLLDLFKLATDTPARRAPLANPAYRDYADHIAGESIDPTTVATAPRRKEEAVGGAPINIEDRIAAYRAALLRTAEAHLK